MTNDDYTTRELNDYLHNAGLGHLSVDEKACPRVSDLGQATHARLLAELGQTLAAARQQVPPISQWEASAEAMLMNDDGSNQAHEQQERFWRAVSTVLFATHALIRLGDLSVFPSLIEMAESMPGHPHELAVEILRHYVDPSGSLEPEDLVKQAQAWWQARNK